MGELVVGRSDNDFRVQPGHDVVGEEPAQGARAEDVGGDPEGIGGIDAAHGSGAPGLVHPLAVGVRGDDVDMTVDEQPDDLAADLPGPQHKDGPALEAGAPTAARRRFHRHHDAVRGGGTGITRPAEADGGARHEGCRLADQVHVGLRRPDVLRRDVAPAQAVDGGGEVAQEGRGLHDAGIPDDDRLAAALRQSGQGRLLRHGPGQAENVTERERNVGVGIETGAAERRTEQRRMDGDDGVQAALLTPDDDDVLVFGPAQTLEHRPRIRLVLTLHA